MKKTSATRHVLLTLFALLMLARCGGDLAGGSGSTTTNGFTAALHDKNGKPVKGALVRVRPSDYLSGERSATPITESAIVADAFTDAKGRVTVGGLVPGTYTIEFQDEKAQRGTVITAPVNTGTLADLGTHVTEPHGTIRGVIDSTLTLGDRKFFMLVYGLERRSMVDSATGTFALFGLAPGTYTLRLTGSDSAFTPVVIDSIICTSGDTVQTDPFALWAHEATLTIDVTSAHLAASDTLVNVPLLLRLSRDNFDFSTAKKKGGDLRVVKHNGSLAPIDADWWDSASATALIWISIDTIYGSEPLQTMKLYWGNGDILSVSRPEAVFDTASGFHGIWHLNESGGTEQKNATVNKLSGIPEGMNGANDISGYIGRAQRFDGNNRIDFPAGAASIAGSEQETASFSAWVKVSSVNDSDQSILASSSREFDLLYSSGGAWMFHFLHSDGSLDTLSASGSVDTWTFITVNRTGTTGTLFINGELADSSSGNTSPFIDAGDGNFTIGCSVDANGYFTGVIDELRMYRKSQRAAWIRLCYESQRSDQQVVTLQKIR